MSAQGLLPEVRLLEMRQQYNQESGHIGTLQSQIVTARRALQEYQTRLSSLAAGQMSDAHQQLDSVLSDSVQNRNTIEKLDTRAERLDIKAPVDGLVKGLEVNTVGSVVQPGQTLMEIVPVNDRLVVSLKIPPKYIGHIRTGQSVQVTFSSYDFSRYGSVPGKLEAISATTFSGDRGERFYEGRVALSRDYVGANAQDKVMPGMTVMADIITGDKTILQYLLKPIQAATSSAFTER
jgi:HlyD family secretion protein/adhesin transport system membrane fusion protein